MGGIGKIANYTGDYKSFSKYSSDVSDWFKKNSNYSDWSPSIEEIEQLKWYTAGGYGINSILYNSPTSQLSEEDAKMANDLEHALSSFELNNGIEVTRQSDFKIFGKDSYTKMSADEIKDYLKENGGVIQNNAFLSFSADNVGRHIMGHSGLVMHLRIPPSKGAGAFVQYYSSHPSENEYLLNRNAVLKFDPNSVTVSSDGKIHITADWLGRAKKSTLD